jgi:hypothetical protein
LLPSGNLGGAARRATSCGLVNSFSSRPTAATATQSFDESGSSSTCSALQFSASAIVCFAIYLLNEARLKAHPEPAKAQ